VLIDVLGERVHFGPRPLVDALLGLPAAGLRGVQKP